MTEPIITAESLAGAHTLLSLGKDVEHTTSSDQTMTIEIVPDKENDASIVIVDSKLAIIGVYISATSLALSFALVIAMFVLVVVLLCTCKRKDKESESANVELTGMRESTTETI
jgi:sensor c-di-GMP phosphodiesterase-like protein